MDICRRLFAVWPRAKISPGISLKSTVFIKIFFRIRESFLRFFQWKIEQSIVGLSRSMSRDWKYAKGKRSSASYRLISYLFRSFKFFLIDIALEKERDKWITRRELPRWEFWKSLQGIGFSSLSLFFANSFLLRASYKWFLCELREWWISTRSRDEYRTGNSVENQRFSRFISRRSLPSGEYRWAISPMDQRFALQASWDVFRVMCVPFAHEY